jgi:uncharacterized cupredoxin-like copper-binding protein
MSFMKTMHHRLFVFAASLLAVLTVTSAHAQKPGVTLTESGGKTDVAEGGAGDSYQFVLTTAPTANVTISLTVPTAQLQANPTTLTFTPGNWNVAQTVNVNAVDDSVDEGTHTAAITHTTSSSDSDYNAAFVPDVVATITDNDKARVTITESGGKTEVAEGGTGDNYQVVLGTIPSANVTVTLSVPTAQLQATPATLTFTPGNWNVAQTVNVSAVDDHVDEGLHTASISHTAASSDPGYEGVPVPEVVVSITDNDKAGVTIAESAGKTEVVEAGGGDSYQLVLRSQPSANVTITLTVPTAQLQATPASLTFTPGNWSVAQTVSVSAVDDSVDEGLHTATIAHTAASSDALYEGVLVPDVVASITDNDKAGVAVTEGGGKTEVTEDGATDSYQIVLQSQPLANVSIALTVPATQLQANPTNLTFTAANWNVAQTVTVRAVDDPVDEGLHTATIAHATASADPNYNGVLVPDVVVSITDNDKAGVTITESGGKTEVKEGGAGDSYQIVLKTQPSTNVAITLTVPTGQIEATPTNLTFTPTNWNIAQTVVVSAVDDSADEGLHTTTITHTAASVDSLYSGASVPDVVIAITDNDQVTFEHLDIFRATNVVRLGFGSLTNHYYQIQYCTNLSNLNWQELTNNMPGSGAPLEVRNAMDRPAMFYRLKKRPSPWP